MRATNPWMKAMLAGVAGLALAGCLLEEAPTPGGGGEPPVGCTGDDQCAADEVCVNSTCVDADAPPPVSCYSDGDCGGGLICSTSLGQCGGGGGAEAPAACPSGADCIMICEGTCIEDPTPTECSSDADCASDEFCAILPCLGAAGDAAADPAFRPCGPDPDDCYSPCGEPVGVCEKRWTPPPPPPSCGSDADCAPGEQCQAVAETCPPCDCPYEPYPSDEGGGAKAACLCEACETALQCVPIPQPPPSECWSDADCGPGQACEVWDECGGYDYACAEGEPCPAMPCAAVGVCVEAPQPPPSECWSDADCGPGQACELMGGCDCGACPDGEPCDCLCVDWGFCVPATKPPVECTSDADCGPGQVCALVSGCGGMYNCPDGDANCLPPEPCDGYGECVEAPQPPPSGCESDADCAAGEICEVYEACGAVPFWCAEGDPACDPMPCQPVGICVPATEPGSECWDDSMCGAGEQCAFDDATCDCGGFYPGEPGSGSGEAPAVCACPGQCQAKPEPPPTDACVVTGCSGQLCAPAPLVTTCEWLPWYSCFELSACGANAADGACGWSATPEFEACMAAYGGPGY